MANLIVLSQRGKEFYRFVAHGPTYSDVVRVVEHEAKRKSAKAPESGIFYISVRDITGTEIDSWQGWNEEGAQ